MLDSRSNEKQYRKRDLKSHFELTYMYGRTDGRTNKGSYSRWFATKNTPTKGSGAWKVDRNLCRAGIFCA